MAKEGNAAACPPPVFFPSINFGRVRGFFIKNRDFELNEDVATIIAQIACHENQLPQGSPCSPIISNYIGHVLDVRLAKLAKKAKCTYSRYADDLTFSSGIKNFSKDVAQQTDEPLPTWVVGTELARIIKKTGFEINDKKSRMQYRTSRQIVTGLVVNQKVNIKADYYRRARSMCHSLFRAGFFYNILGYNFDDAGNEIVENAELGTINQLNGILSHIYYVKNIHYERTKESHNSRVIKSHNTLTLRDRDNRRENLLAGIKRLYFRFLFFKYFYFNEKPLIICEGKTDIVYLKCALDMLAKDFPELVKFEEKKRVNLVTFFNYTETVWDILGMSGSSSNLAAFIRSYKENLLAFTASGGKKYPVIILVDNDSGAKEVFTAIKVAAGLKEEPKGAEEFYFVRDNLYVVPTPKMGLPDSKIENFFDEATLNTVLEGKVFNPSNEGVDGAKEYGKHVFATQVVRKRKKSISFSQFKLILRPICNVIMDYERKISPPMSPRVKISRTSEKIPSGKGKGKNSGKKSK